MLVAERNVDRIPKSSQLVDSEDLQSAVRDLKAAITMCPYIAVRQLHCECVDDTLTISGHLSSFFLKQVAIELVRRHQSDGIRFEQAIEVD